ncbi:MAG: NAD-dependent epimerase/dehydratase family protein [Bacteroidota bacterium]
MILVTGGSGFLGGHLVRHLSAQGLRVRALYYANPPAKDLAALPNVTWMQCDLLDVFAVETAMEGITDVYHCAGMVSFEPAKREEMLHFNPESTANIVNEALVRSIRKMVYVSSVAAIGRTGDPAVEITEEAEWGESRYNSAYGLSKYLAETEVWRGIGEGLDAAIVNPGIILGPCDSSGTPAGLMRLAYREFPFYTQGVTSWVDVADVVAAMVLLMGSAVSEERFILSAGNSSFKEVLSQMATALGKKPPRYKASSFMTGIVWRLSTLQGRLTGSNALITKETASNANSFSYYNNSKFTAAFPSFTYQPMAETIMRMARSFSNSL